MRKRGRGWKKRILRRRDPLRPSGTSSKFRKNNLDNQATYAAEFGGGRVGV